MHLPQLNLDSSHPPLRHPRDSPPVLVLELDPSDRTIRDRGNEQYRPDASDNQPNRCDQDVESRNHELLARTDNKGLQRRRDVVVGLGDRFLLGEAPDNKGRFRHRERGADGFSLGVNAAELDGWDKGFPDTRA